MVNAYNQVIQGSQMREVNLRLAAYTLRLSRVAQALTDKGFYP
jgi:glutamate dehydrogenase/leucine dehydrogenase